MLLTHMCCAGLEPSLSKGTIQARAVRLTSSVLEGSDAAILMIDARFFLLPTGILVQVSRCSWL